MKQPTSFKSDLAKLKHSQQFLAIAVLFFACAIVWVIFSLFSSQQTTTITANQKKLAQPLTPIIDIEAIDELENKTYFSEEELAGFTIYQLMGADDDGDMRAVPINQQRDSLLNLQNPDATVSSQPNNQIEPNEI